MVQLQISEGPLAGNHQEVCHFPFRIGRAAGADLRLEGAGVWDQHLKLDFDPAQGFALSTLPPALATVNGWPIEAVILRNGDTIEFGSQNSVSGSVRPSSPPSTSPKILFGPPSAP